MLYRTRSSPLTCLSYLVYVVIYSTVNGKGMERWSEKDSPYLSTFDNGNLPKRFLYFKAKWLADVLVLAREQFNISTFALLGEWRL